MEKNLDVESRVARDLDGISPRRQAFDRWFLSAISTGLNTVLSRWLLLANLTNGLILFGAVLVPAMRVAGLDEAAGALFEAYQLLCQQIPERSYFLWGHQLAMDQRMMAIYGSSLAAGLAYVPLRGRLRPLPWRFYFLMILPMALDGFTQLFGWRHSNWELRTATGTLFGAATVWLAYPALERYLRLAPSTPQPPA